MAYRTDLVVPELAPLTRPPPRDATALADLIARSDPLRSARWFGGGAVIAALALGALAFVVHGLLVLPALLLLPLGIAVHRFGAFPRNTIRRILCRGELLDGEVIAISHAVQHGRSAFERPGPYPGGDLLVRQSIAVALPDGYTSVQVRSHQMLPVGTKVHVLRSAEDAKYTVVVDPGAEGDAYLASLGGFSKEKPRQPSPA